MREPPEPPIERKKEPSGCSICQEATRQQHAAACTCSPLTIVGDVLLSGRLPGAG
jgi:hypothetical protein